MIILSAAGWAGAQLALTSILNWVFIPIMLATGIILAISETVYAKKGGTLWKEGVFFWSGIFGVSFVMSLVTGFITVFALAFNYKGFLAVFDTPLLIGTIVAVAATAVAFSVNTRKCDKGNSKICKPLFAWISVLGTLFIVLCVSVAATRCQYPAGMQFDVATLTVQSTDYWAHFSDLSINKFLHTLSGSLLWGGIFSLGTLCFFLVKGGKQEFAGVYSKIALAVAVAGAIGTAASANASIFSVARHQGTKLSAMYSLQNTVNADTCKAYCKLSKIVNETPDGVVLGLQNYLNGGYALADGSRAKGVTEKTHWGTQAISAIDSYKEAMENGDKEAAETERAFIEKYQEFIPYAALSEEQINVPDAKVVSFWFKAMKILGAVLAIFIIIAAVFVFGNKLNCTCAKWFPKAAIAATPVALLCYVSGWMLFVKGNSPWIIQGLIPANGTAHSAVCTAIESIILIAIVAASCYCAIKSIKKATYDDAQ